MPQPKENQVTSSSRNSENVQSASAIEASIGDVIAKVSVNVISANRQQPRTEFDPERLQDLAESIKRSGVIQPLIVVRSGENRYELVAGERRLRAARLAGLSEVPVVIRKNLTSEELLEFAIVENIQRENLNPIEEAKAYQSLMTQFNYTQDDVAQSMGKSRSAVANIIRLLQLPKLVQDDLANGRMDSGHARALLALSDLPEQLAMRDQILREQLTVRDVERMVSERKGSKNSSKKAKSEEPELPAQIKFIVEEMTKSIGTKVTLRAKNDKSGQLIIEYYSLQDLDRIYRKVAT